jgi:hypothetical protein
MDECNGLAIHRLRQSPKTANVEFPGGLLAAYDGRSLRRTPNPAARYDAPPKAANRAP